MYKQLNPTLSYLIIYVKQYISLIAECTTAKSIKHTDTSRFKIFFYSSLPGTLCLFAVILPQYYYLLIVNDIPPIYIYKYSDSDNLLPLPCLLKYHNDIMLF